MNLAYLILAHDNPRHLARLIGALARPTTRVYVHLDAKADFEPFRNLASDQVIFCERRIDGAWGTISLVEATLALVRTALAGPPCDYYALLSGACYPLRSNAYIDALLARSAGTEYIEAFPFPEPAFGKSIERLTRYYIRRNRPFAHWKWKLQDALHALLPPRDYRKALDGLELAAGSQWWVLTPAALRHVLDFIAAHPGFYAFCRHIDCPDEFVFQMALWNSPFRASISHSLTFTHWVAGMMGPVEIDETLVERFAAPRVLDSEQNNSPLPKQEVVFARKFTDGSARVLDVIDRLAHMKDADRANASSTT